MTAGLSLEREEGLLKQARSTQPAERDAAFAVLVREFGPSLLSLSLGITGNRSDAEDALQDALCTIALEIVRFRGDSRIFTWCYRIALRAAVRIKSKNRPPAIEDSGPPIKDATTSLVERDEAKRLLAAIAALPIEQRTVLTLFSEGHAQEEIAEILEIPIGTVWSRLHASRKELRAKLGR